MRLGRAFFSAMLGLALCGVALDADAFCLTHGCTDEKQHCEYDENDCLLTGPLLHWGTSCVSFDVQKDGSGLRDIPYGDAHNAIVNAFTQWLNADCGGGYGPALSVRDFGPVDCRKAEYNQDQPNANVFMFRDEAWPYENAIDTLALTTLIFNADTGEIYDADVEVNTYQGPMSLAGVGPSDIDFDSVITHEVGHFLGLSHSKAYGATMHASYAPGQTDMASIEQDDIDGVCTALAPGRDVASGECTPRHGFSSTCALKSNCAMAPGSPGALGSLVLTLLGLSSPLLRKRFRPSTRRPSANRGPGRSQDSAS